MNILDRVPVTHMAQMQNMLDFPPAPKLTLTGHLDPALATESELRGEKPFTLRGIKDSPPYLHDGRCLTLEDTVEFFNLVQGLKLANQEKSDLVAFLRQL
jgi:hypothetical protein